MIKHYDLKHLKLLPPIKFERTLEFEEIFKILANSGRIYPLFLQPRVTVGALLYGEGDVAWMCVDDWLSPWC